MVVVVLICAKTSFFCDSDLNGDELPISHARSCMGKSLN